MSVSSCRLLIAAWAAMALGTAASAQSLPAPALTPPVRDATQVEPRRKTTKPETPKVKVPKATVPEPKGDPALDPKAARLDAQGRLKPLTSTTEPLAITPGHKALRETLEERIRWLDAYDKAVADRDAAENPNPSPLQETVDRKADLEHAKAVLDAAANTPGKVLPELFQGTERSVTEAKLNEMREAIDSSRSEVKDRFDELEKTRGVSGRVGTAGIVQMRADRDKIALRAATLPTRRAERETAVLNSTTGDARDLARERLATFDWEARAEAERIKAAEAQIRLEVKRIDLLALTIQARDLQLRVAKLTLEQMQNRYRAIADSQQNDLRRAAATEAVRATSSEDMLERFKSLRRAELLELQALLISDKKALAANPKISLLEQTELADRAQAEFANLKGLLKDEKVSSLDALQLNNDFRRVTRERNLISRNELTEAAGILAYYENLLTQTELDLLSDSRDDRFELESLLSLLPESRHAEARSMVEQLNHEHRALLVERRIVLDKLAGRSKATHAQVLRRLETLDQEYAFVRANLFWIRDAEPIGLSTIGAAKRELRHCVPGLGRLFMEPFDRRLWSHPSIEFSLGMATVFVLPFPLVYLRRAIRRLSVKA